MHKVFPPESCKVYTPRSLADAMVATICRSGKEKWLEPGCGQGVFLEALQAIGVRSSNVQGVDLETTTAEGDSYAKVLRGVDFLSWSANKRRRFNCVIGNPPYVAIRDLPKDLRSSAAQVRDHLDNPIGSRANLWYAFLQASIRLLKDGGNVAFILPAACEYADYCLPGRVSITHMFERVDLIRSQKPLFNEVQEGSVILICRNKRQGQGFYRRHVVTDLPSAINRLNRLSEHRAKVCIGKKAIIEQANLRFGDLATIRLGGVTGDTEYFTFSEQRRRELKLPVASVQPIVSRCRHIRRSFIDADFWNSLKTSGERVWLFNPSEKVSKHLAVKEYLGLPPKSGGCRKSRFKIRIRDPWYRTPLPEGPHGFISGMSSDGTWIALNEMDRLNATNTLYVVHFQEEMTVSQRYACALTLLTSVVSRRVHRMRRRYADGLEKLEPGQIADIVIPPFQHVVNARAEYRKALSSLLKGDWRMSRQIADAAVFKSNSKSV